MFIKKNILKNKNVHIFIQARLSSVRLPGKVLMPIYGRSMLQRLIERVKRASCDKIIVTTSENPKDIAILKEAAKLRVSSFAGDEHDCLSRFVKTAHHFNTDIIVRVTADNPFTDHEHIDRAVSYIKERGCDYVGIKGLPLGAAAEAVTLSALEKVYYTTEDRIHREHVTSFIYTHPEEFEIYMLKPADPCLNRPDFRLTVDTKEDFELIKRIYKLLGDLPSLSEVIQLLEQRYDLAEINKHIVYPGRP